MPQESCVPKTGGDPRLVVFVSLANQSEPIVQGYVLHSITFFDFNIFYICSLIVVSSTEL